ncbi:MAG: CBS domain-containing protein, partial [Bacillota bacterium]
MADVMTREVRAVRPDDVIEEAAWYMSRYDYTALPVVEEDGTLVGIITAHDLFRALVDMLALTAPGTRVTLVVPDRVGILARIAEVVRDAGVSIASVAIFPRDVPGWAEVVLRLKTTEAKDCVDRLVAAGFNVTHVSLVWA